MNGRFIFPDHQDLLGGVLPELHGELTQAPQTWPEQIPPRRGAAVALIFIPPTPGESVCRLVLTLRSTKVGSHKGQIALPGGRRDVDDANPAVTACREAWEEVGLTAASMTVHGVLPVTHSLDGSVVYPVVITARVADHDFAINPSEVAELILVPWTEFTYARHGHFSYQLFGVHRQSYLFATPAGYHVWGLTANILRAAQLVEPQ